MPKIIKIGNAVTIFLSNGDSITRNDLSSEEILNIVNAESEEEIVRITHPEISKIIAKRDKAETIIEEVKSSTILSMYRDSIYWEDISKLSIPKELVIAILDAEDTKDEIRLEAYKNFWTLMSLNPNEECRNDLFWFLTKYGLTISRSGFFVSYRNVCTTSEEGVFTDYHSHTMRIKIGEMVTMPREECDCNSNNTCSQGLIM